MDLRQKFPISILSQDAGERLDYFLAKTFQDISRSRWSRLIKSDSVVVNNHMANASYQLKAGDVIDFHGHDTGLQEKTKFYDRQDFVFTGLAPDILFEDDDILVINKPKGLTVHIGAGVPFEQTLVAWLMHSQRIPKDHQSLLHFGQEVLEEGRPGIVHRLDKPTSGALLICKNPSLVAHLSKQFASKEAKRKYWAFVSPKVDVRFEVAQKKILDLHSNGAKVLLRSNSNDWYDFISPIARDVAHRTRYSVQVEGKLSHTRFRVLESQKNFTWLDIELLTGRTHQIRVHCAFLGYPLIGDDMYGGHGSEYLRLHAYKLTFRHPTTHQMMDVVAPLLKCDNDWVCEQGFLNEPILG